MSPKLYLSKSKPWKDQFLIFLVSFVKYPAKHMCSWWHFGELTMLFITWHSVPENTTLEKWIVIVRMVTSLTWLKQLKLWPYLGTLILNVFLGSWFSLVFPLWDTFFPSSAWFAFSPFQHNEILIHFSRNIKYYLLHKLFSILYPPSSPSRIIPPTLWIPRICFYSSICLIIGSMYLSFSQINCKLFEGRNCLIYARTPTLHAWEFNIKSCTWLTLNFSKLKDLQSRNHSTLWGERKKHPSKHSPALLLN